MDDRIRALAKNIVHYSCKVKKGEKVYMDFTGTDTYDLARAVIKEIYSVGGRPYPHITDSRIMREMLINCDEEQLKDMAESDAMIMDRCQCYVGVRGSENVSELSDVSDKKKELHTKLYTDPVHHKIRVRGTRWVVLRYPNASMAQLSDTSQEAFEDFYFNVCNLDYSKMERAFAPLKELMEKTDKVRIVGPGTDLTFSIKGIPAVPCAGEMNIPDGEIFTAPVRESVNGVISYNTPSLHQGVTFEDIKFTFKNGKIIEASASSNIEELNKFLDRDEGARYIGEFAIGVNPYILKPMKDILFDEKICGSIHFTPGNCYEDEANNGNRSVVHWDLVLIQRPEYGGGEIYFDDVLIRKDGRFVLKELDVLNAENLM